MGYASVLGMLIRLSKKMVLIVRTNHVICYHGVGYKDRGISLKKFMSFRLLPVSR